MMLKRITILGSTGSIGQSTLKVLATQPDYQVFALTANENVDLLLGQCQQFRPEFAVIGVGRPWRKISRSKLQALGLATKVLSGPAALVQVAADPAATHVMAAIVGGAGLAPSFAAAECWQGHFIGQQRSLGDGRRHISWMLSRDRTRRCCPWIASTTLFFSA